VMLAICWIGGCVGGSLFVAGPSAMSFSSAKSYCQKRGMTIASIHSASENAKALAVCRNCWIGGHCIGNSQYDFEWVDGYSWGYTNWNSGEPNNYGNSNEDCVQMYSNGKWNDNQCSKSYRPLCRTTGAGLVRAQGGARPADGQWFYPEVLYGSNYYPICGHYFWDNDNGATSVCKAMGFSGGIGRRKKTRATYSKDAMPVGRCNAGQAVDRCTAGANYWGNLNGLNGRCKRGQAVGVQVKCSVFVAGPSAMSFSSAKSYCRNRGMTLASIRSSSENAMALAECNNCWIGGHSIGNSQYDFEWVDGSSWSYTNWNSGEPNNYLWTNEDCVHMYSNGKWNDNLCSKSYRPLCRTAGGGFSAYSANEAMAMDFDEYDGIDYDEMIDEDLSDESVVPAGGWSISVHYHDLVMVLGVMLVVLCAVNLGVMLCRRGKAKRVYSPVKFAAESDTEMEIMA